MLLFIRAYTGRGQDPGGLGDGDVGVPLVLSERRKQDWKHIKERLLALPGGTESEGIVHVRESRVGCTRNMEGKRAYRNFWNHYTYRHTSA